MSGVGTAAGYQSEGEAATADYLMRRRLPFEHHAPLGGRNPDFVATHPITGDVALEVFEPELSLPGKVGAFDSIKPLERGFKPRKREQARAARDAGIPFVLVAASTNSDIPYDSHAVAGALFGRPGVTFPVGVPDPGAAARWAYLGPGKARPDANTSVSAMALISYFNPTEWRLQAAWHGRVPLSTRTSQADVGEALAARHAIYEELVARGIYLPELRRPRLRLFHNPWAAIPLDLAFAGQHDEQTAAIQRSDGAWIFTGVSEGRCAWEVRAEGKGHRDH
jgi:hypothetical protein